MSLLTLKDGHHGQKPITLDRLIARLLETREEAGRGDVPVTMIMEPHISGQGLQLEEQVMRVSCQSRFVQGEFAGVECAVIVGRSFDSTVG